MQLYNRCIIIILNGLICPKYCKMSSSCSTNSVLYTFTHLEIWLDIHKNYSIVYGTKLRMDFIKSIDFIGLGDIA